MSEFKKIVDYFKFNRRGEKADKETAYVPILYLNASYNTAIETDITSILKTYITSSFCKYIGNEIEDYKFYFRKAEAGHHVYYIKENISVNPKYRRIPLYLNTDWEVLPANEIHDLKELKEGNNFNRYFDQQNDIVFETQLDNVTVFPDYFLYHPNDIKVPEGEYNFDFQDHEGYDASATDWALRVLLDSMYSNIMNFINRQVEFYKKEKSGLVNLLPKLSESFIIRYTYYEKGIKQNGFMARRAVKLKFKSYEPFLEYLNQTIFYHLNEASLFDTTSRDLFLDDYIKIVSKLLRQAKGEDILKVLYYVPLGFFINIDRKFLWEVLDETLKGNVTNANTNTEDIVLHIFKGLAKSTNNNDAFLQELLKKHGEKETRFSLLYNKLNGKNFKTFVSLIHNIWFQSSFKKPDNKLYKKSDEKYNIEKSPFVVNYEANKEATFFYSNKNISWVNANILKFEPDTSWWDEIATVLNPALGEAVKQFTETEKSFYYHPFQPIAIKDFDKQQTGVTLAAPLMPAFVLKAGEDKAFWENVTTATEYAIDIVTTFSGVGNLAKFRHLAKVASKANKLKFVSRAGKVVANAKAITRGAVGVIEISSGTVNALLKITNLRDEKWARELSEFLLILELLSLGADLGEFLLKRARSSAANALVYEDEIRNIAKKEGIEDVDGLLDELYEVAGFDNIAKNLDSIRLTKLELEEWIKIIRKSGAEVKYYTSSKKMIKYFKDQKCGACFDPWEIPPIIWIRKDASALEMYHESMHFEDFLRRGKDAYIRGEARQLIKVGKQTQIPYRDQLISSYIKEKYVLDKILEEQANWIKKFGKGRFTDQEIEFSKKYFNELADDCIKYGIDLNKITIKP